LSDGVVGLAGRAAGLSGDVVGLSGRVVDLAGGLLEDVFGFAGRAGALSGGCSFGFFSCSAAGESVGPASKANASPANSQRDFDFK
jgi:hypothetical protein